MPQYLHDQTEDSMSHLQFIDAFLASKHAERVNLDPYGFLSKVNELIICAKEGSTLAQMLT